MCVRRRGPSIDRGPLTSRYSYYLFRCPWSASCLSTISNPYLWHPVSSFYSLHLTTFQRWYLRLSHFFWSLAYLRIYCRGRHGAWFLQRVFWPRCSRFLSYTLLLTYFTQFNALSYKHSWQGWCRLSVWSWTSHWWQDTNPAYLNYQLLLWIQPSLPFLLWWCLLGMLQLVLQWAFPFDWHVDCCP